MAVGTEDQELQAINGEFCTNGWMADLQNWYTCGSHSEDRRSTPELGGAQSPRL